MNLKLSTLKVMHLFLKIIPIPINIGIGITQIKHENLS
jgi:hypothetical protein